MFVKIVGARMSNLSKIYSLIKLLENLEIKLFEYEIAQRMEDDAYGNLWYEEKIKNGNEKIEFIKSELKQLVSKL